MGYKKCLVIFIDILGSQDRSDYDELLKINRTFHMQLEKNQIQDKAGTVYRRKIYTFSDCAYIIYDYKEGVDENRKDLGKLMNVAMYNTETVINAFLSNGFICRGGIAYGDVYYEEERSLFFGPAVNRAYQIENKEVIYPRIVVDDYVAEEVIGYNNRLLITNWQNAEMIKQVNGTIVKKDTDGKYIMHYLNRMQQGHDYLFFKNEQELLNELIQKQIEEQDAKLAKNQEDKRAKSIIEKYKWLERYLGESVPIEDSGMITCQYEIWG